MSSLIRKLAKGLKTRIREWLLDDDVRTIRIRIGGQVHDAVIHEARGPALMVSLASRPNSTYLITIGQAVDKKKYWKAWKAISTQKLVWEDGEEFNPEDY